MTGRYVVWMSDSEMGAARGGWRLFCATCRSLARDGLQYEVLWALDAPRPSVTIRAHGTARRRAWKAPRATIPHTVLTLEQCRKRRAAAQKSVGDTVRAFARHIHKGLSPCEWTYRERYRYDPERKARRQVVGRALGVIRARHPLSGRLEHIQPTPNDYALLDEALGMHVLRLCDLRTHERARGYFRAFVTRYANGVLRGEGHAPHEGSTTTPAKPAYVNVAEARADVEYWRELETLSGQRAHWKPGRDAPGDDGLTEDEIGCTLRKEPGNETLEADEGSGSAAGGGGGSSGFDTIG